MILRLLMEIIWQKRDLPLTIFKKKRAFKVESVLDVQY